MTIKKYEDYDAIWGKKLQVDGQPGCDVHTAMSQCWELATKEGIDVELKFNDMLITFHFIQSWEKPRK